MKTTKNITKPLNWHRPLQKDALKHGYLRSREADRHKKEEENCEYFEYFDFDECDLKLGYPDDLLHYELKLMLTEEKRNWSEDLDAQIEALHLPQVSEERFRLHPPRSSKDLAADLHSFQYRLSFTNLEDFDYQGAIGRLQECSSDFHHLTSKEICVLQDLLKRLGTRYTESLLPMMLYSRFWIRRPSEFTEPRDQTKKRILAALAHHLFVRYEIPPCLKFTWCESENAQCDPEPPETKEFIRYILLGQGASLHRSNKTFGWNVSKRFTSLLFQVPADTPLREILPTTEMMQQGLQQDAIQRILRTTTLFDDRETHVSIFFDQPDDDFRQDSIAWLGKHLNDLDDEDLATIWDYAYHRFLESRREGPEFRWAGRSVQRLLESAREYEEARRTPRNTTRSLQWKAHGWDWTHSENANKEWSIVELTSSKALSQEGAALLHCVGGYDSACHQGRSAIFSLRLNGDRTATIELCPKTLKIKQAYGRRNRDLKPDARLFLKQWKRMLKNGEFQ